MMKLVVLAAAVGAACAYVAPQSKVFGARPSTKLHENFGFDFAPDPYEAAPDIILGEANYKQWVNRIDENSFLNRKYNVLRRVRELNLLKATVDAGVLSSLEEQGLDLVTVEKLLPLLEQYGLLSLAANNQQLLLNLAAPLLIEGAPILLPLVAGAIKVGAPAFYLAAAVTGGLEVILVANDVEVPLVGLPAGVVLGLLLVPLTAVFAGAGVVFGNLKK